MTTLKYKVGDKLKVKAECKNVCFSCNRHTGWIEITEIIQANNSYWYNAYNSDGKLIENCGCYQNKHIEGYYNLVVKKSKWTPEPVKYHNGTNRFTKSTVCIDGKEMTVEEFKAKTTLYRSALAAYNNYFPTK